MVTARNAGIPENILEQGKLDVDVNGCPPWHAGQAPDAWG